MSCEGSIAAPGVTSEKPAVIVLAAGRGRRFQASGGTLSKLDAPLLGVPVLQHVLNAVASSGLEWHVVRSAAGGGMGDSIAAGVRAMAGACGWLILPGDLPLVTAHSVRLVAASLASHPVVVPHWLGRQGHPVGFRSECLNALLQLSGESGAASIVRAHRGKGEVLDLALDDRGVVMDVDTLDDLADVESLMLSRGFP